MGIKSKFKNFFLLEDEYEYAEEEKVANEPEETKKPSTPATRKQNVVSLQSVQQSSKVILIEPRVYAEAQEVADHLVNRRAVVVNLQRIQHDQAVRIVDFLSGTVYAIGGDIQRIGKDIFLCTPDNVEVSGNITEMIDTDHYDDTRWS
ncbi:cell division protein SepF [Siminovitchia sp. FSL H7-0308]|uniref:Cell division protein SepF n=1 Tax=Siminovitchia thermophila TaxID=1245522 RepID=A0ABS2R7H3_9BACI|nr:cell division protein SepF [Siminovitchia thermophila]MBM7715592.1 cell division inhibitor SepF [Siminovitchia thermophila]ONK23310.1 cell division protein SepF [Bacillus sp. VT-16-64]